MRSTLYRDMLDNQPGIMTRCALEHVIERGEIDVCLYRRVDGEVDNRISWWYFCLDDEIERVERAVRILNEETWGGPYYLNKEVGQSIRRGPKVVLRTLEMVRARRDGEVKKYCDLATISYASEISLARKSEAEFLIKEVSKRSKLDIPEKSEGPERFTPVSVADHSGQLYLTWKRTYSVKGWTRPVTKMIARQMGALPLWG